ncbi:MFS transporter [Rhizobium sp.]
MSGNRLSTTSGAFEPLKNATFRAIWLAGQISGLGWLIQTVAIGWLMTTISVSDLMVALVQTATTLPAFLLSIFVGAFVDNYDRRRIMLIARLLMALASVSLTILISLDLHDPWIILLLAFVIGCATAFNDPAWQASVGDIVERQHLAAAVTLTSVGFNTIRSVGPAIGGILVASFGPIAAFTIYSVSHLAPLGAIWRYRWTTQPSGLPPEPVMSSVKAGIRFVWLSGEIRSATLRGILFGVSGISILALLPLVVRDHLQGGAVAYGVLMAGFGGGALLTGLLSGTLRQMLSEETLIKLACILCGLGCLALATTHSVAVAALALVTGGAGWVLGWSGLGVSVQWASPRWMVGRAISIYYALTYGGLAAGSWIWGMVAQYQSLHAALTASGLLLLIVAAVGMLMPVRPQVDVDHSPASGDGEPLSRIALGDGPIVASIVYKVAAADIERFLDLMIERRDTQRRAGALRWTLSQDIEDPGQLTETFQTPTWADYRRLRHRATTRDSERDAQIAQLQTQGHRPEARLSLVRQPPVPRTPSGA